MTLRSSPARSREIDFYGRGAEAMRGELALFSGGIRTFFQSASAEDLVQLSGAVSAGGGDAGLSSGAARWLMPRGWIDQNAALSARILLEESLVPLKARDVTAIFADSTALEDAFRKTTPYNFFAKLTTPAFGGVGKKIVESPGPRRPDSNRLPRGNAPVEFRILSP